MQGVERLSGGDGDHLIDVVHGAAAAEVVDRPGDTLEDGADAIGLALGQQVVDILYYLR